MKIIKWICIIFGGFFVLGLVLNAIGVKGSSHKEEQSKQVTSEKESKWSMEEEVSKMTDSKNVYVMLKSDSILINPANMSKSIVPHLLFRCMDNKIDILFYTGVPLSAEYGNALGKTVKLRFDKDKAINYAFNDGQGTFDTYFASKPIKLLNMMKGHSKLLVAADVHRQGEQVFEFDINELEKNIKPIKEACSLK